MNLNNYLTDLHTTTLNLTTDLAYGYGDLATTEINNLRNLLSKAEEMIPVIETEACMAEAEELDREDRSFNYWMTMLYGKGDVISPMDSHSTNKANRLKRRKANKKYHKADRYHGKSLEPFLYKEDGEIKESIEPVWRDCRYPVFDKVHDKSAFKADAREQEYLRTPFISEMEIEQEEKCMTAEENRILDNHYALENALSNLKEGKYISLLSYWNGEYWEDSIETYNMFCGIETKEQIKDSVLTEQAKHQNLPEIKQETIHNIEGISFKWNGYWDEYYLEEGRGYITLTFLPIN